jgi:hypothetical protein
MLSAQHIFLVPVLSLSVSAYTDGTFDVDATLTSSDAVQALSHQHSVNNTQSTKLSGPSRDAYHCAFALVHVPYCLTTRLGQGLCCCAACEADREAKCCCPVFVCIMAAVVALVCWQVLPVLSTMHSRDGHEPERAHGAGNTHLCCSWYFCRMNSTVCEVKMQPDGATSSQCAACVT